MICALWELRYLPSRTPERAIIGDHKLLRLEGKEWKDAGTVAQHRGDYRFVSAQVGFVTSRAGISRTQDGGRHWERVHACHMTTEVDGLSRNLTCEFAK